MDPYWPSLSGFDLAGEVHDRARKFFTALPQLVAYRRTSRARRIYYGLPGQEDPFDISKAGVTGDQGELTSIRVGHAGSIARRAVALVAQTVPEWNPIAENDDYDSLTQVELARRLLDYYMDTKKVGAKLLEQAEGAIIDGGQWLEVAWDPMAGTPIPAEQMDPSLPTRTKTGDLVFRLHSWTECAIDLRRKNIDHDWMIVRRNVNKYDLAARYPAYADNILSLHPETFSHERVPQNAIETELRSPGLGPPSDEIPLLTLYHRKTDAMPQGRWAEILSADLLLAEGPLPYSQIPLIPVYAGKIKDSVFFDSLFHHILGIQEVYDVLASSVATNNVQTATQIFTVPEDAEYSIDELGKGASVLRYKPGIGGKNKPEALVMTADNSQAQSFMKSLREDEELILGINSTLRGAPQPNVTSGSFGALLHQEALEYHGPFQYSFQQAVGQTGDLIIEILKQYADQPIVAEIAGEANSFEVVSFTKDKLSRIRRVSVKSGNPAARTPAFNMSMADQLLAKNPQMSPKDYITLARTGEIDTVIGAEEANNLRIRQEDAMLRKGIKPTAVATDSHSTDIKHHRNVLGAPGVRDNPAVVQAVLAHIQEHIDLLRTTDPQLLMAIGETPMAPPAPTGAPQGTPPGPPPGKPGAQPGPDPTPPPGGQLPVQPSLPNNPLTGAQATPMDGAIRS